MIPALILILAAAAYRVVTGLAIYSGTTWLSNFAPFTAVALCGAVFFPPKFKFTIPLSALFISDLILNVYYDAPLFEPLIICRYLALGLVGWLGLTIARKGSLKVLLVASLVGSTLFYVVTNVFSWLSDPGYAKDLAGLIQALTIGLPQYGATPTWMFFRNSVLSDLIFTGLFVFCLKLGGLSQRSRPTSVVPRPV